jgi:opacity protein-like surface antigen
MFMRNVKRLGAVAIAVVLAIALAAPAVAADITVGQFIQQLARAKNLNATDAKIAADSLAAVGIALPSNLRYGAVLTEGDVSAIARSAGLNVRTASPQSSFDSRKSERFFSSFSRELEGDTAGVRERDRFRKGGDEGGDEMPNGEAEEPSGKGKGKGKGKNGRTPSEPD